MPKTLLRTSCGFAALFLATAVQADSGVALSGKVSSAQEPTMEGVLVSAKRDGSNVTTTVVTNAQGVYSFPADKLAPGHSPSRFAPSAINSTARKRPTSPPAAPSPPTSRSSRPTR